jgi:hypothetical protein
MWWCEWCIPVPGIVLYLVNSGVTSGVTWVGSLWRNLTRLGSLYFPDVIEIAPLDGSRRFLTQPPGWLKRPLLYH